MGLFRAPLQRCHEHLLVRPRNFNCNAAKFVYEVFKWFVDLMFPIEQVSYLWMFNLICGKLSEK